MATDVSIFQTVQAVSMEDVTAPLRSNKSWPRERRVSGSELWIAALAVSYTGGKMQAWRTPKRAGLTVKRCFVYVGGLLT